MTKALPVPDWLTLRAGSLKPGVRPETQFVLIGDQPLYKLEVRPATGKFTCAISNTVNGKRLEEVSDDDWERTMAVNLTAIFRVCRATLPLLRRAGGGSVVDLS